METSPSNTTSPPETSARARTPAGTFDLGDDDLVADGGTQIMRRDPVSEHPSSLAALTAALEAKKLDKGGAPPRDPAGKQVQMFRARPPVGRKPPRVQPTLPSRVATAVGPVGLPPAPKPEPNLDDLAFEPPPETKIERTQPFRRGLFGSVRGVEPTLESPVWRPRPSAPAHGSYPPPDRRPTSIAPISVDVSRSMPPSWSQPPASWAAPKKSHAPIIAAVVAGCVGLCAMALVALVATKLAADRVSEEPAFASEQAPPDFAPPQSFAVPALDDDTTTDPSPPLVVEPLDDEVLGGVVLPSGSKKARTSTRSAGIVAGTLAPPPPAAAPTTTTRPAPEPAKAEPAPATTTEPAPPPVATSAPAPAPPPPPIAAPTTGVVQVSPSLMTVMVDGDYKRVRDGRVVVTCGRHRINAGRGTRIVDVPCGGVASMP